MQPRFDFKDPARLSVINYTNQKDYLQAIGVVFRLEFETQTNMSANTIDYCLVLHDCVFTYSALTKSVKQMWSTTVAAWPRRQHSESFTLASATLERTQADHPTLQYIQKFSASSPETQLRGEWSLSNKAFYTEELVVYDGNAVSHSIFRSPFPFKTLLSDLCQAKWSITA